jgi:transposase
MKGHLDYPPSFGEKTGQENDMTQMALRMNDTTFASALYMALELSKSKWKVGFSYGHKRRTVNVEGGDVARLKAAIGEAKAKFKLPETVVIRCCYEAGRDGFWLHRLLTSWGIDNLVVDPASIEVNRRARRTKTDRVDLEMLLSKLRQHHGGERVWKVVRVPDQQAEGGRHLHREAERLKKERSAQVNRIKGLLFAQGIRLEQLNLKGWPAQVAGFRTFDGQPLAEDLRGELQRAGARLALLASQLKELEKEQDRRVRAVGESGGPLAMVRQLRQLKGIGRVAAWVFVMEFFGWRQFRNGKQVGALAGLTGTPYASGDTHREQGISKAGNRRVRSLAVEISWLWLRYQPDSALSRWFRERFGGTGKRHRRVGIVALARKLLVALWRYLETGLLPEGAVLKAAI